jgi:hypothetical protein
MSIHGKLLLILVGSGSTMKKSNIGSTQLIIGDVMYRITEVSELGQPCAPKKVKGKFVSQCGAIVRDNVPIKYRELSGGETWQIRKGATQAVVC